MHDAEPLYQTVDAAHVSGPQDSEFLETQNTSDNGKDAEILEWWHSSAGTALIGPAKSRAATRAPFRSTCAAPGFAVDVDHSHFGLKPA